MGLIKKFSDNQQLGINDAFLLVREVGYKNWEEKTDSKSTNYNIRPEKDPSLYITVGVSSLNYFIQVYQDNRKICDLKQNELDNSKFIENFFWKIRNKKRDEEIKKRSLMYINQNPKALKTPYF